MGRSLPKKQRPTAVALRYDGESEEAPRVVASGKGLLAERIVEEARHHDVPIREDAQLARVLGQIEVGREIPPELYRAVAEIIAFIYRLNQRVGP